MSKSGRTEISELAERLSDGREIIGIVSKPGVGKTSFMMQVIDELSFHRNKNVLVLSLEMSESQWKELGKRQGLNGGEMFICDDAKISIEKIDKLIRSYPCDVVAIDYLQLLEIGVDLSELKKLLRQSEVSAIITSQMASRKPSFCEAEYRSKYPLFDSLIYLGER